MILGGDGLFYKGYDGFREGNCCNVSALEDVLVIFWEVVHFFPPFSGRIVLVGRLTK